MYKKAPILILIFIIETTLLGTFTAGCVHAQRISYSGSMQYTTGSYFFDETTESFSLLNGLSVTGDKFSVSVNLPFVVQNSPWVSYSAAGYIPTGCPQHKTVGDSSGRGSGRGSGGGQGMGTMTTTQSSSGSGKEISLPDTSSYTQSNLADPNLYAYLKLFTSESGASSIQLNTNIKFPFTDPNNGFGTGEWDYGLGLSASQRLGTFFIIADIMKWWFGDLPDLELQDPLSYGLAIGKSLGPDWMINSSFNGYTEIIDGYDPPMSLGIGIGYFASATVSLNSTFAFGLTESSSDFSVGLGWNVKL